MKKLIALMLIIQSVSLFGQIRATTEAGEAVYLFKNGTWAFTKDLPIFNLTTAGTNIVNLELPEGNPQSIVKHSNYTLEYSNTNKQARWVAYRLNSYNINGEAKRKDKFTPDPKVPRKLSASDSDYKGSGYDRGHLCPSADMIFDQSANDETFFYSNMSPQNPSFNRGIWKKLEDVVRGWATEYSAVFVATGGVLNDNLSSIGKGVSVPKYFYKAILRYSKSGDIQAIGLLLPNESSSEPLQNFVVAIDSLEKFTGINFFYNLDDNQEEIVECFVDSKLWIWKEINANIEENKVNENQKGRCKAITQAGSQCKRDAQDESGYCWQHKDKDKVSPSSSPASSSGTIHTGPRGGKYKINSKGNKVYIKKKK